MLTGQKYHTIAIKSICFTNRISGIYLGDMDTKKFIAFIIIVIGIVVGMRFIISSTATSSKYTDLVKCMADKDVKFYGAFWCPHCQEQERSLDMSRAELETAGLYIECSTPDGNSQTQVCIDKKVASYPSWDFGDGVLITGELKVEELAEKSSCPLPAN